MADQDINQEEARDEQQEVKKGKKEKHPLPYTLEVSFMIWRMIIVVVASLTAFLSWWNGADLMVIGFRSAAAILSLGGISILFNSMLSKSMLEAVLQVRDSQKDTQ
jgi:hypothetical protein